MRRMFFCPLSFGSKTQGSEKGPVKVKRAKKTAARTLVCIILLCAFLTGPLFSDTKKLRVTAETARIYLEPKDGSTVIATVEKGTILTLRNIRKIKKIWNHVYFATDKSGVTKSGYIQDSYVERLFVVTTIETLDEGKETEKHFRDAHWGMRQDQVMRLEGAPSAQDEASDYKVMRYWESIKDMGCWIDYIFEDDKLVKARYIFLVKHEYKTQYFGDYKKAKDFLTEVHGQSPLTNVNWLNAEHKDDYSKWGLAVSLGHLEYSAIWDAPETEIVLRLYGENNEVKLVAEYTGELEKEKKKVRLKGGIAKIM